VSTLLTVGTWHVALMHVYTSKIESHAPLLLPRWQLDDSRPLPLPAGILFTAQYMMYTSDYTPVSKLKDLRPLAPHAGGSAHILRPNCSIYVLDVAEELNDMATMPPCDPEKYSVWPHRNFPRGLEGRWSTPHHISQHAAPFYLHQAILQSPYVTDSIDTADIVFVHQHCYTVGLSDVARQSHAPAQEPTPSPSLASCR
jgi:hypothetical protein